MSNQIIVPSLGESVTEATVSKWLKQVGEKVDSDEPLVELETDKVNVEVPSPLTGTLSSIRVKEGDTVEVGALLGLIQEGKASSSKTSKTDTIEQDQESYVPPKIKEKKDITKKTSKKRKKMVLENEISETLTNEFKEENSNGTLVLETLVDDTRNEIKEKNGLADLLIGNNVLAHVPNINDFISGLKILLSSNGIITMEFPHILQLIQNNEFDTIYHEHFSYLSLYRTNLQSDLF